MHTLQILAALWCWNMAREVLCKDFKEFIWCNFVVIFCTAASFKKHSCKLKKNSTHLIQLSLPIHHIDAEGTPSKYGLGEYIQAITIILDTKYRVTLQILKPFDTKSNVLETKCGQLKLNYCNASAEVANDDTKGGNI